jgi:hypothetical protein
LNVKSKVAINLGAFFKLHRLQKVTISYVMSIDPNGITWLTMDGFPLNLVFEDFRKFVKKFHVSLKYDKNNGYFTVTLM